MDQEDTLTGKRNSDMLNENEGQDISRQQKKQRADGEDTNVDAIQVNEGT